MSASDLSIVAIIPARGGSKRIPSKNTLMLAGHPLLAHTILHAKQSKYVSEVYVSTDDEEIAGIAKRYGADVIDRPAELSGDQATSEAAILHVLDERIAQGKAEPDLVVFLQCTSPVRYLDDIDKAVDTLLTQNADSLFSACHDRSLYWKVDKDKPDPFNYDFLKREREQDRSKQYRENGSIFVFRPAILRESGSRLGGKIAMHEMDEWSSFEVDQPEEVELISWILRHRHQVPPLERVDLIIFDFDGVMTDNKVYVSVDGIESVACNRGDGWGIARVRDAGIPMIVMSTEENTVVKTRCEKLKISCFQGLADKIKFLKEYLKKEGIDAAHTAYVGNDVNDIECMNLVGIPIAVADAEPTVRDKAVWVTKCKGGDGAVREVCDRILKLKKV